MMIDALVENGFWFHIGRFLVGSSVLLMTVWALELFQLIKDFEVRAYCWKAALLGSLLLLLPVSLPQAPTFYLQTLTYPAAESSAETLPSSVSLEATDSISSVSTSQRAAVPALNDGTEVSSNALLVDSTNQDQATGLAANLSSSLIALFLKVSNSLSAIPMSYWLILIWGLGSSLALTRLFLGYRRGMLQLGKRQLIDDSDPILKLFHALCEGAGIRKQPRLTRSERFFSPVTLPGNEICLPAWVDHSLPESELRSLLAHELGHVRHHDLTVLLGLQLLTCLFFFQPLFILARNRLVDLSEFLADQAALDHCESSNAITTALINCASRMNSEKPFKWGFAMIGNTSRLKLRILQLQNAGRLTARRFNKSGRVVVLTAICTVVLLTPTMQNETKADVAVSPEPIELIKNRQAELEILGKSLETPAPVNTLEPDFGHIQQALEEESELSEPDNEQTLVLEENNLRSLQQPLQQTIVQPDEEIEVPRRQLLEINQPLLAQSQQQQLREQQQRLQDEQQRQRQLQEEQQQRLQDEQHRQRHLQEEQQRLQDLSQQLSLSEEYQDKTYILLNYSSRGPMRIRELGLTETGSQGNFRIRNIQSLDRGDEKYILAEIEPGSYHVSSYSPVANSRDLIMRTTEVDLTVPGFFSSSRLTKFEDSVSYLLGPIQIVENSINYIGDIHIDTNMFFSMSGIREFEFSPSASTLLSAAGDNPELFRTKDIVVSIATHDPVAIDSELLDVFE